MTKKEHDDFWTKWKRELTKDVRPTGYTAVRLISAECMA